MELRITGQHLLKIWLYLKDIHVYLIFSEEMARIIIVCIMYLYIYILIFSGHAEN